MYAIDSIYVIRYLLLPFLGLLASGAVFFLVHKNLPADYPGRPAAGLEGRLRLVFVSFLVIYALYFFSTIILRYYTHHLAFFDFGVYDWRIWRIHAVPWARWPEKIASSLEGHFQPVLVLYSFLYDLGAGPVVLNILQGLAVFSGVFPLYLIARKRLEGRGLVYAVTALYLLYPATQFNMAIDFHPDHLVIPLFFWSYYLVERGCIRLVFLPAIAAYAIKEPYILAFAFFGIYMAWDKKRVAAGAVLFTLSMTVFFITTFFISSSLADYQHIETITGKVAYGYLFEHGRLSLIMREVLDFRKWRFPFFILSPLLFIPLAGFRALVPALPLLAVQMLSTVAHHQSVGSQYTAGFIAPVFVSFVAVAGCIGERFGRRALISILAAVFVITAFLNVAHSPSPLAVAFWKGGWSHGRWHYTNYLPGKNFDNINSAIDLVPEAPDFRVVTHSLIYNKRLAHRYSYSPFPERWRKADFIILDNSLEPYVSDSIDEGRYRKNLADLSGNREFSLIYKKGSVILYRRRSYEARDRDGAH
ncbi:MAG: DUF2079 domain-containing protein [Thermodesulfobacteriota bacterium]